VNRALLIAAALLLCGPAAAAEGVSTRTVYDDDREAFITSGKVELDVPFETVSRVAAAFGRYGHWSLRDINRKPGGKSFITQLHQLHYRPGGSARGAFDLVYDVDLVWPFGSEGDILRFAVREVKPAAGVSDGIERIAVELGGDSAIIEAFDLVLEASGDSERSVVRFRSETRFVGIVDTFFTLSVYRRNIEWRIAKVIRNLKAHVQR